MKKKIVVNLVFLALLLLPYYLTLPAYLQWLANPISQAVLSAPIIFWLTSRFHFNAWRNLQEFRFHPDILLCIALFIGFFYSLLTVFQASHFLFRSLGLVAFIVFSLRQLENYILQKKMAVQRLANPLAIKLERQLNQLSVFFIPAVLFLASLVFFIWRNLTNDNFQAIIISLAILIAVNPRTINFSIPLSMALGKMKSQKRGIYFSDDQAIEKIADLRYLVFNLTGVLTEGKVRLIDILAANKTQVLELAASLEQDNVHPLAQALKGAASRENLYLRAITHNNYFAGKGVVGRIADKNYALGNMVLMKDVGIVVGVLQREKLRLEREGKIVLVLGAMPLGLKQYERHPGEVIGLLVFEDGLRPGTRIALEQLKNLGIESAVISGQSDLTVRAKIGGLAIKQIMAEILPDEKSAVMTKLFPATGRQPLAIGLVSHYSELSSSPRQIAKLFIGAEPGFHELRGDLTIIGDDTEKIVGAIKLATETFAIARQNFYWSIIYNFSAIFIAGCLLLPLKIYQPLVWGAIFSGFSSLVNVLNAARLQWKN